MTEGAQDDSRILKQHGEEYQALREKRYGKELMNEASLRPEDTPETYQERLLCLYPKPEQQAYIKAMFAISEAAVFGMYAMQSYAFNEQIVPEVEEMFPQDLNSNLKGTGNQEGYTKIPLQMAQQSANSIIVAANIASYEIMEAERNIVNTYKQILKDFMCGNLDSNPASIDSREKQELHNLNYKS
jgi:hypothetical protein